MIKLDKVDHRILNLLQENAKLTTKEIAADLGLSITPVYERIKRLERHKIILKQVALVDRKKIGKKLIGFCNVSLNQHNKEHLLRFEQDVVNFSEVLERTLHQVSVFWDDQHWHWLAHSNESINTCQTNNSCGISKREQNFSKR